MCWPASQLLLLRVEDPKHAFANHGSAAAHLYAEHCPAHLDVEVMSVKKHFESKSFVLIQYSSCLCIPLYKRNTICQL
jgi:hypothetical protein